MCHYMYFITAMGCLGRAAVFSPDMKFYLTLKNSLQNVKDKKSVGKLWKMTSYILEKLTGEVVSTDQYYSLSRHKDLHVGTNFTKLTI